MSTQPSRPLRRYVIEIDEIQASIAHECRVLSRTDLHRIKDLFLLFSKILTRLGDIPIRFGFISP